jgi:hypothetical protein
VSESPPHRQHETTCPESEDIAHFSREVKISGKVEHVGDIVELYLDFCKSERSDFLDQFPEPFIMQNSGFVPAGALAEFLYQLIAHYLNTKLTPFKLSIWALKETSLIGGPATLTIGRSVDNDVVLHSKRVSNFHGMFVRPTERWMISDNNSSNGTFLHQERIRPNKPFPLTSGCEINFGHGVSVNFIEPGVMYDLLRQIYTMISKGEAEKQSSPNQ